MKLWYLSFASADHFLGACVVRAEDLYAAQSETKRLGINPGGEVLGWDVTAFSCPFPFNTLMSKAEMAAIDGGPGLSLKEMSAEQKQRVLDHAAGNICEDCNS